MKNVFTMIFGILLLYSCGGRDNKNTMNPVNEVFEIDTVFFNDTSKIIGAKILADTIDIDTSSRVEVTTKNLRTFENNKIERLKKFKNGISIKWFIEGQGRKIKDGEMVFIEYRLALPDGKIIAGNNPKSPFFPFVVGYNMQTIGWDLAFKELKVGDFAKIELPTEFAYGAKGIKGLIPPNSKLWLFVKVYAFIEPGYQDKGIKSWSLFNSSNDSININSEKEYKIQMTISTKKSPNIINTYFHNTAIYYKTGQNTILPGLRKIVETSNKGDRFIVLLPPKYGFGKEGYGKDVTATDTILVNMEVVDIRGI